MARSHAVVGTHEHGERATARVTMRTRSSRHLSRIVALAALASATACILADPGADVPRPAPQRPHIIRPSVVPASGAVLGTFPEKFIIPVELSDPTLPFWFAAFVDYDPNRDQPGTAECNIKQFDSAALTGQARIVEVSIPAPPDLDSCHVIEVIVALQIICDRGPNVAHSPGEPGADSVSWTYSPTGDLSGCPTLDAGLEASRNDDGGQGLPP
jgi:hypothetical protein